MKITRRYRMVLKLRREKRKTFLEIGTYLGVTRQRAQQIYARALRKEQRTLKLA